MNQRLHNSMFDQASDIPGFRLLRKVSESALTETWSAHQVSLDRHVNLKFLKADSPDSADDRHRFVREAQHAACLRHPNIVAIYNVIRHERRDIVIMEHVEGQTVYEILATKGAIPWKRAARIACAVAEALGYAWDEAQLIHRNVTPASIRIEGEGTVKFAYIGLSTRIDSSSLTRMFTAGAIEGAPNYMSPEQARGASEVDFRTDMYGLGATLYHMLTGYMPFSELPPVEAARRQIDGVLPYPTQFNVVIPPSLLFSLSKLLRKSPGDRYNRWSDVTRDLKKILGGHLAAPRQVYDVASTLPADIRPRDRAKAKRRRIVVKRR